MGDVWRCHDAVLERDVAVKILLPALLSDAQFVARFRAEARIMAALRHPGIVQVHDFGEAGLPDGNRVSYLVTEYVDGESLLARIGRAGRLTVGETLSIVAQTAQALHAAHLAGIVHRDVKPENLLVQRDGSVVLVDFGLARSASVGNITANTMVLGTACYMSPEQVAGQPVSAATDIYALGAVAYCCLAGRPPFTGDNPMQVALRHMREEPPPLPPDVPAPVAALIARALAKDRAGRYRSAAEFADAARAAQHATLTVPPSVVGRPSDVSAPLAAAAPLPRPAEPNAEDRRERRLAVVGTGGGLLVALIMLIATAALWPGPEAPEQAMSMPGPTSETSAGPAPESTSSFTPMPKVPGVNSPQPRPTGSSGAPTSSPTATPAAPGPVQSPLPTGYTVKTRTVNRGANSSESYDRYIEIYNGVGTLVVSGQFISDPLDGGPGDALKACDSYADGMGAELRMDINPSGGFQRTDRVASTRGHSSPYCSPFATGDMVENTLVALKLCLLKGTTEYCTGTYYARA